MELTARPTGFSGASASGRVSIPAEGSQSVSITSALASANAALTVGLPAPAADTQASVAGDGTVTFGDDRSATAVTVQAFDGAVRISTVLRSAQAPSEFAYPVAVPAGATLQLTDNGGVIVVSANGSLIGGFAAPWAKDASGKAVPTHYEIRDSTVVQVVDHTSSSLAYPIVADPYLGIGLIDHATWVFQSGFGYTFEVVPTAWARANAGSSLVGVYDWDELYSRYSGSGLNTNLTGMRDQLICHQVFVAVVQPTKPSWNLDEWRPNVGLPATVTAQCNPGGGTPPVD